MAIDSFEKETRSVFHDIHSRHLEDKESLNRFRNLLSTDVLDVEKDFFSDKICVDLGAGTTVNGTVNLLNMEAKFVYALDLDETFIGPATDVLSSDPSFERRWELNVGSLVDLPYDDECFDFALCHGVVHHVSDDVQSLKEIHRVLKVGGSAYISVGGGGGILERFFKEFLRDEYNNNKEFADLIDNYISDKWFHQQIDWLIKNMPKEDKEVYSNVVSMLKAIRGLINNDFILSVLDRIKAPKYKMYTKDEFNRMLLDAGFKNLRRVTIKPMYYNIRRTFQPLHGREDILLSRLLYGDGINNYFVYK